MLPSLKLPVAVNCGVSPTLIEEALEFIVIDCSVTAGAVTLSTVEPLTPCELAVMVVHPVVVAVAKPPLTMEATALSEEVQVATLVRSKVEPSVLTSVAKNCCMLPAAIVEFFGVAAIDCNVTGETVSPVEPVTELKVALIMVFPAVTPVATPVDAMVAEVFEDCQLAVVSCLALPSLKVPKAANCCAAPVATE